MLKYYVCLQTLLIQHLRRDDRGASAVEYGLLVALIAGAIVVAVTLLGTNLTSTFNKIANNL